VTRSQNEEEEEKSINEKKLKEVRERSSEM
jgi:hypothetical protein